MTNLRGIIKIMFARGRKTVYAISAAKRREPYFPGEVPMSIRSWVNKNYPGTKIECIKEVAVTEPGSRTTPENISDNIFHIGFTKDQAEHFLRDWSALKFCGGDFVFVAFNPPPSTD